MSEESSNNKRIAKNTLLLYFRMLFLMVISLFTSRINLQSLGVEDFGIYNVVGGVVSMFTLLSGALSVSISRNITYELGTGNKERLSKIFCTAVNIQLILSFIIIVLAETVGLWFLNNKMVIPVDRLFAANWVFQFSLFSFVIGLISVPYNADIIAHERMSAFAYISILEAVLKLSVAYALYVSPFDKLITFSFLLAIVSFSLRLIYGVYCKRNFEECSYRFIWEKPLLKEMVGFAGWSMFGLVAYTGYTYGINILLNLFFGPVVNAARGIAVQVQTAVQGFSHNFQMAINPQIIKSYAANDFCRLYELIFASSKYCYFLLLLFSVPIIIKTPYLLNLWLGTVPEHTVNFLRLVMIIITFDSLGSAISTAQQATGNIKLYQVVVGGIMLLIIPVAYFWLTFGGIPEIVYVVYFLACVCAHISRLFIIRNMIGLSLIAYSKRVFVPISIVTVVSFIIPLIITTLMSEGFASFILVCVISFSSVITSVFLFGLSSKERDIAIEKVKELKYKFVGR